MSTHGLAEATAAVWVVGVLLLLLVLALGGLTIGRALRLALHLLWQAAAHPVKTWREIVQEWKP